MKEKVLNTTAVLVFFSLIIIGVVLVNARLEHLEQKNSANEPRIQIAQNQ